MKLLLGTHAFHLHLLDFNPATSSIKKVGAIKLKEQPSFTLRHPTLRDLWYVTAWVDSVVYVVRVDAEQGKFEVLGEAKSGGGGPTFFTLTDDVESLLIANYRSGEVTRLGVEPTTGLFVSDAAAEDDILALPFSDPESGRPQRLEDRQSSSHPHQVIPLPKRQETDVQTFLVPDLGGDALFVVSYSTERKWKIWSKTSVESGWGPRHAVVNTVQGTPYLYLVNELVNKVSIHPLTFTPNGIPEIGKPTEAYSTLPLSLQDYVPKDAFESIACAIILHTTPEGAQQLIITNRNASEEVRPEGDSIIIFPVSADGATLDAEGAQHLVGAGRHLRAAGVTTGEDGTAYLLVGARNGNGLTVYRQGRGEEGRWEEVVRQVQLEGIEMPISVDWI